APPFLGLFYPLPVFFPFGIVNKINKSCRPVVPGDWGEVEDRTPDLSFFCDKPELRAGWYRGRNIPPVCKCPEPVLVIIKDAFGNIPANAFFRSIPGECGKCRVSKENFRVFRYHDTGGELSVTCRYRVELSAASSRARFSVLISVIEQLTIVSSMRLHDMLIKWGSP